MGGHQAAVSQLIAVTTRPPVHLCKPRANYSASNWLRSAASFDDNSPF